MMTLFIDCVYAQSTITNANKNEANTRSELRLEHSVAVVYPDIREPYLSVFKSIIKGISTELDTKIKSKAIKSNDDIKTVSLWLEEQQASSVISLGSAGLKISELLSEDYNNVVGAVLITNQQQKYIKNAISMTPAPHKLFSKLKDLSPHVEKISVIYDSDTQGWLIEQAKLAAMEINIQLHAIEAKDTRSSALIYRELLSKQQSGVDALWLLQGDQALKERSVLYMILKNAWDKNLIVFSSNPSHVTKGVLFSLYPDNEKLGKSLAKAAVESANDNAIGIRALEDLLTAVNVRTAEHLGLNISRSERREFDMVFPIR